MMQVTATKSIMQELLNSLHGNKFSPWEDFFVHPFGSNVISLNQLCKCNMYVYQYRFWSKHMQWNNEEVLLTYTYPQGHAVVEVQEGS